MTADTETVETFSHGFSTPVRVDTTAAEPPRRPESPAPDRTAWYASRNIS